MIEPEMAFCDLRDDMDAGRGVPQAHLHARARALRRRPGVLQRADRQDACIDTLEHIVDSAVRAPDLHRSRSSILEQVRARRSSIPVEWGMDLQSEHERYLTEEHFKRPVILTDYPQGRSSRSTCARTTTARPCARWTCWCRKVGEIIGGSQREERLDVLEQRMAEQRPDRARTTGGISTCAATARCRTPASASASSASCSSSPAWPTSAT